MNKDQYRELLIDEYAIQIATGELRTAEWIETTQFDIEGPNEADVIRCELRLRCHASGAYYTGVATSLIDREQAIALAILEAVSERLGAGIYGPASETLSKVFEHQAIVDNSVSLEDALLRINLKGCTAKSIH